MFELQRAVTRTTNHNGELKSTLRNASNRSRTSTGHAMASWDPTYPGEKIDWYSEYIARHAPLSVSWLRQPYNEANGIRETLETRGLGLYNRDEGDLVVAPMDDGSICIWNLGEDGVDPAANDGEIVSRSRSGLLSVDAPNSSIWQTTSTSRAKTTSTGVVECVSIDKFRNKAYFAVHSGLNEVDLSTLQVSDYHRYPFSISALSETTDPIPLTVGTTLSLHIHDPRRRDNGRLSSYAQFTDRIDAGPALQRINDFQRLASRDSPHEEYATLFHPSPLSIAHHNPSSMIYVAGRFPSILTYDRRFFPKLTSTIHSGARLCSLTALPSSSSPTLVAAGEYNGKGSLELYPLPTPSSSPFIESNAEPTFNRTSASRSKLLSLTPHGTRLLFSDSDGQLKWVERDGSTLVRRWNINAYPANEAAAMQGIFNNDPNEGDVARKLLPVSAKERSEMLLWTGEKIGVLGFKKKPRFAFGADDAHTSDVDSDSSIDEQDYARIMRRALERQANEVRFVRGLGLGSP